MIQIDEGDTVLIRAKVARANDEIALVCIEHARHCGELTPFSVVVEKTDIVAVMVE